MFDAVCPFLVCPIVQKLAVGSWRRSDLRFSGLVSCRFGGQEIIALHEKVSVWKVRMFQVQDLQPQGSRRSLGLQAAQCTGLEDDSIKPKPWAPGSCAGGDLFLGERSNRPRSDQSTDKLKGRCSVEVEVEVQSVEVAVVVGDARWETAV